MSHLEQLEKLQQLLAQIMQVMDEATIRLALALQQALDQKNCETTDLSILLSVSLRQEVQGIIREILQQYQYCNGAGFASHMSTMSTQQDYWVLEWWFKNANRIEQAHLESDQGTQQRLDFRTFEWFHQAATQNKTYMHGPYVDYICNTAYTITVAHPILVKGHFIGVAVVDLMVSTLEQFIRSTLNALKKSVIITNQDNRVIISNIPKIRTGSIFKDLDRVQIYDSTTHPIRLFVA